MIRVQAEDFDIGAEIAGLKAGRSDIGAIVAFVGTMRDRSRDYAVDEMTLEHYPGMTEKALEDICVQADARWKLLDIVVIHRVGSLKPGDRIVMVGVASAHRGDAFEACEFIMDYLKTRAPFWKRESGPQGARWVEADARDRAASTRWEKIKDAAE